MNWGVMKKNSLLENIFSVKNSLDKRHKVVTLLGLKIKIRRGVLERHKIMSDRSLYIGIPDNITLQMSFNNYCNCKCKFCFEDIAKNKEDWQVIPEEWLYDYFLPLYPKTSILVPTYGEITFCKEGYKYLSFINENFPHINIFIETNGILFNDNWAQLAADNLMIVHFSINAINNEYFKKTVWDKDGVYDVIQNNFNHYLNVLKENGLSAFAPSVSCVFNSTNYDTVREFVKQYASKGVYGITCYYDQIEDGFSNSCGECESEESKEAFITAIELNRVLKGKVDVNYKVYAPTNRISKYENIVDKKDINSLKEKYADILELVKDMDLEARAKKQYEARKQKGKHLENMAGITYHQAIYGDYTICHNPWSHIRLRPNGDVDFCAWRQYRLNLKSFIKKDHIDWEEFFNCLYYRKARKNFKNGCYEDCRPSCPGIRKIPKNDYIAVNKDYREIK